MPVQPERIDGRTRRGLRPVRVTVGPALGLRGWYREARRLGWTRRAAAAGAWRHRLR